MKRVILFGLLFLISVKMSATFHTVLAQNIDCGNGLPQRLEVGNKGWIDPAPPAQGVRIRQSPGQLEVTRLKPGDTFTVIDGPQCFENASWWEIRTETDIEGWIAEGIEAGKYFVDPLNEYSSGDINLDPVACVDKSRAFTVGEYVKFVAEPTVDMLFYGHPLIPNAFLPLSTYFQNSEYDTPEDYLPNLGYPNNMAADYLITNGPECVNGEYFWQVQTGVMWTWLNEQYIKLSADQPHSSPIFIPKDVTLKQPPPSIISPQLQVRYDGSAGGGGGGDLNIFNDGCRESVLSNPSSYTTACISIYPIPVGESVHIVIKQIDDEIVATFDQKSEKMALNINNGKQENTISTSGVRVPVPTMLGVTTGVYIIDAISPSITQNIAYRFEENYTSDFGADYNHQPVIVSYCDSGEPILVGMNFASNSTVQLVYAKVISKTDDPTIGTLTFDELYRWTIDTGNQGEFLATIFLDLPNGFFVIADDSGNWQSNFQTIIGFFGDNAPLAESLRTDCKQSK